MSKFTKNRRLIFIDIIGDGIANERLWKRKYFHLVLVFFHLHVESFKVLFMIIDRCTMYVTQASNLNDENRRYLLPTPPRRFVRSNNRQQHQKTMHIREQNQNDDGIASCCLVLKKSKLSFYYPYFTYANMDSMESSMVLSPIFHLVLSKLIITLLFSSHTGNFYGISPDIFIYSDRL